MTTTNSRFFHINPTSPARVRLEEVEHYFLAGNLNEALAAAQQAWREHEADPDVFRVLAYIHMARGEYPPAAQAAYQSVKLEPNNAASYASLAQVYVTFNMLPLAEETLAVALRNFHQDAALLVLQADVCFRRGRDQQGEELASRGLAQNPGDSYAKALLGTHHLKKKRYAQAADALADAVVAYPTRWDYLRDSGIALLHLAQYDLAKLTLTRSVQLHDTDTSAKQHLLYALKFGDDRAAPYWKLSWFFFNHTGLGWTMNLIGWIAALTGFFWTYGVFVLDGWKEIGWPPVALLVVGVALIVTTMSGIVMRSRRGQRFDQYLQKRIGEQAPS
ncbi:MAG: tetratricopeptide repeat protein [Armatimonadota bacterium]